MNCPFCQAALPEHARFCPACGQRVENVRERHLPVTVLYVDLSGYTRLVQTHTPEEVSDIIARFFAIVEEEVTRTGGFLYQKLGDGALCIFGYPRTIEDTAERALLACSALLKRMPELGMDLDVHGGVATGKILVVPGREVRFVGPPMNLAARLQSIAPRGVFLVDETTRHLTRHAFRFSPAEERDIPGFGTTTVYALKGVREKGQTWRGTSGKTVFVGRTRELTDLLAARERFHRQPGPWMVRIIGEPGIGKTRLVVEFLKSLERDRVLIARAFPYDMPPFGPLVYALKRAGSGVFSLVESAPAALQEILNEIQKLGGLDPEETLHTYIRVFRNLCQEPTVFVLEDAQWADSFTFRVLTSLLRQGTPLFLIFVARKPLSSEDMWSTTLQDLEREFPALTFRLHPFTARDIREWWQQVWGEDLPEEQLEKILKITGGNPLLLEEYARYIQENPEQKALPRRLEELLLSQLDRLPPESRELLEAASLVGHIFFREPLMDALGWNRKTFENAVHHLETRNLVVRRTVRQREDWQEFAFRHILFREAILKSLSRSHRKNYALKLLAVFQHENIPTLQPSRMLARFAWWAGDARTFRDALFETAERFATLGGWKELLEFLNEFENPEALLSPQDMARLRRIQAQALVETGRYEEAREVLSRNREHLGDHPEDQILEGVILEQESRYAEALAHLAGIHTLTPEQERARLEEMIWVAYLMGREDEVERLWTLHERLPQPEDPLARARILNLKANTLPEERIKRIIRLRYEVLALAVEHGFPHMEDKARNNLAVLASRGRVGEALLHLERSVELAKRLGNPLSEAIARYNLGEVLASI